MPLFEVQNLTYYYPETETPALKNINLRLEEGELVLVVGGSGSGKSSLVRALAGLIPDFYGGKIGGKIYFQGRDLRSWDRRRLRSQVGLVFQDPEKQLVMTTVEAEVAFGLENLGLPPPEMSRRVAEVMSYFNLSPWQKEFIGSISGGQKQKVALASVLAMQPEVLLLDEPTSQLDPVAAEEFFSLVEQLNKEMGYTVVLIEQRLERCLHLADRLILMERGEILQDGPVEEVIRWQARNGYPFLPPVAQFFASLAHPSIPLTVKAGRQELRKLEVCPPGPERPGSLKGVKGPAVVEMKEVWFAYPGGKEALKGINLRINAGEFVAIMGENAAGKSTLLKHMAGLLKPGRGRVTVWGKDTRSTPIAQIAREVGYLPQNPEDYLFQDTVEEELRFTLKNFGLKDDGRMEAVLERLNLSGCRQVNPRDLSSGERERVALAAILVARPRLLLLDEPTRGLDFRLKAELGRLLSRLTGEGVTVVTVTHDVEWVAEYAERVILMYDGRIVSEGPKAEVLSDSLCYSPQMARLFRGWARGVLTVREGLERVRVNGERLYAGQSG